MTFTRDALGDKINKRIGGHKKHTKSGWLLPKLPKYLKTYFM